MEVQQGKPDVVVVGGGPIGLASAWRAAQRGLRVLVLDAGAPGAWSVAAGMLAPVAEADFGEDALLDLNLRAAAGFPAFCAELAEASGEDPGLRRSGTLGGLPAGARIPLRPVKGQILRLRDAQGPGLLERIVRFEGGYLVPRGDGRYVLGATMEERGFDTTVTAGALYELLRDAGEVVPGVHELVVEEAAAGLRPATPDNAPVLGAAEEVDGLVWATGHHRNGILLAPVTADVVADVLDGTAPPPAFAPDRFARTREGAAA